MTSGTTALRLEEIRKLRGVSLEEISDTTKISTRFLRAIETEEFEKLPGGVFNTNYIRQYASAIGFSSDILIAQYITFDESRRQAERDVQAGCEARRGGRMVRWVNWLRTVSPAARAEF
jgi:cytoskeletal protein RodZ